MVDLVQARRDPDDLARENEPTARLIRKGVAGVGGRTGERPEKGRSPGESDELIRLRREVRQRRQEGDVLARAAAWVARGGLALRRPGRRVPARATQASVPATAMARGLGVSTAGYDAWLKWLPSAHANADAALSQRIRTLHVTSRATRRACRAFTRSGGQAGSGTGAGGSRG